MNNLFVKILTFLNNNINFIINKLTKSNNLSLNSIVHNSPGRYYQYHLTNNNLLTHKDLLRGIYNTLMADDTFKNFGKFKVIIVVGIVEGLEFNYHQNILLSNNTSFVQYYNKVKDIINTHYEDGYPIDTVQSLKITIWNMDTVMNKNIKITATTVKNYKPGIKSTEIQKRGFHTSAAKARLVYKNLSLNHFTPCR